MVWHQAVGVEIEGEFGFLLLENAGEPEIIIVGSEYLSTIIPASDDVIEPSAYFDPWFARHGGAEFIDLADQMSMKSSLIPPDVTVMWSSAINKDGVLTIPFSPQKLPTSARHQARKTLRCRFQYLESQLGGLAL